MIMSKTTIHLIVIDAVLSDSVSSEVDFDRIDTINFRKISRSSE
jgi:hypothetical protein